MSTPINISASRGAAILGLTNWGTPVYTWLEIMETKEPGFCKKNNYELPEFEENAGMRWGTAFESAIIELAERKRDDKIVDREMFFKRYDYITCHIDGKYISNPTEIWPLHEGKTTSFFYWKDNFGEPGTDKVPIEYQIQCQHQLICTGAEKVILSVLVFPRRVEEWEEMGYHVEKINGNYYIVHDKLELYTANIPKWAETLNQMGYFHQYEIKPHDKLQKKMIKRYKKFWNENILKKIPPEPQSYDDIKALCPEPVGTIVSNDNIERLMMEYKNIGEEIGESGTLAERRGRIKVQILNYMRNAGVVEDDESKDKWILRSQDGKKIASYGRNKKGVLVFR